MAKRNFGLGILAIVLVFSMSVIGCDDDDDDTNILDTFNFSNSAPSTDALSAGSISQAQFDQIKDEVSGFKGWAIDEDGYLVMAWTGRNESDFNKLSDFLKTLFTELTRESEDGIYLALGSGYFLSFWSVNVSNDGYCVDTGTMILYL